MAAAHLVAYRDARSGITETGRTRHHPGRSCRANGVVRTPPDLTHIHSHSTEHRYASCPVPSLPPWTNQWNHEECKTASAWARKRHVGELGVRVKMSSSLLIMKLLNCLSVKSSWPLLLAWSCCTCMNVNVNQHLHMNVNQQLNTWPWITGWSLFNWITGPWSTKLNWFRVEDRAAAMPPTAVHASPRSNGIHCSDLPARSTAPLQLLQPRKVSNCWTGSLKGVHCRSNCRSRTFQCMEDGLRKTRRDGGVMDSLRDQKLPYSDGERFFFCIGANTFQGSGKELYSRIAHCTRSASTLHGFTGGFGPMETWRTCGEHWMRPNKLPRTWKRELFTTLANQRRINAVESLSSKTLPAQNHSLLFVVANVPSVLSPASSPDSSPQVLPVVPRCRPWSWKALPSSTSRSVAVPFNPIDLSPSPPPAFSPGGHLVVLVLLKILVKIFKRAVVWFPHHLRQFLRICQHVPVIASFQLPQVHQ